MNDNGLFQSALVDPEIVERFSDAAWVDALVRVEVALAAAQASAGVTPASAATTIAERLKGFAPDRAKLAAGIEQDGFPIIELVAQLRARVGGDAARFVHWGATTQDILDTALVLQLRETIIRFDAGLTALIAALVPLVESHRATLMVGRTHGQPALPVTFGLKAAGWLAPLVRHRRALAELRPRLLNVQLGGAAGTLASLGTKGPAVADAFATSLQLGTLPMPWHAQREGLLEFSGRLALIGTSLAKFAQDTLLLAQAEVGEVRWAGGKGGGSSAMPQKQNPIRSEAVLVATRAALAAHSALLGTPAPEHERGTQTTQAELLHLPQVCAFTGGALRAATRLVAEMVVDAPRMRSNLAATHGVLLAEAATLALTHHLDAAAARRLVTDACAVATAEKRHLLEVLRTRPEAAPAAADLPRDEADYLGSTSVFIDRVLADARR
jgi:3-carboxy-cis,cis-muconate cycloisomerase